MREGTERNPLQLVISPLSVQVAFDSADADSVPIVFLVPPNPK
jgi:hypothetical protein